MKIALSTSLLEDLVREAANHHPNECCGILLGEAGTITSILPADNIHPAPKTHFEIDPQALVDAHRAARSGRLQVLGYYHSHPASPSRPSDTDRAMASGDGRIWAIIGEEKDVSFWRDGEQGFEALPYTLVQG